MGGIYKLVQNQMDPNCSHWLWKKMYSSIQGCTTCCILASGIRENLRENENMKRKWRGNTEKWGNGKRFTLYISSFTLYFLPLYPLPISKTVSVCRKMLDTALLSQMSQKTYALWENYSGKLRKLCRPASICDILRVKQWYCLKMFEKRKFSLFMILIFILLF